MIGELKPFNWEIDIETGAWTADTLIGRYRVFVRNVYFRPNMFSGANGWDSPHESIQHGKDLCWQDYQTQVAGMFEDQ